MGIHQLSKVLGDHAPGSTKDHEMKTYFGEQNSILIFHHKPPFHSVVLVVQLDFISRRPFSGRL